MVGFGQRCGRPPNCNFDENNYDTSLINGCRQPSRFQSSFQARNNSIYIYIYITSIYIYITSIYILEQSRDTNYFHLFLHGFLMTGMIMQTTLSNLSSLNLGLTNLWVVSLIPHVSQFEGWHDTRIHITMYCYDSSILGERLPTTSTPWFSLFLWCNRSPDLGRAIRGFCEARVSWFNPRHLAGGIP